MVVMEATQVAMTFREGAESVAVLKGASLGLERGEIVALEGPSGSGKTTFLTILGCMLTPSSGRVTIEGREVDPGRPDRLPEFRRRSIGFVFQQFNLFPALTALENVEYALNLKGWRGRAARAEAGRVLAAVGLGDRSGFLPCDLSGGQKQRVAIARALAGSAPILLADEPTANLDSHVGAQVLDLFRTLAKREDRALLIVTHDPKVRAVADRVARIEDGVILDNPLVELGRAVPPLAKGGQGGVGSEPCGSGGGIDPPKPPLRKRGNSASPLRSLPRTAEQA
jgi:putative ABC transport system ATP-binding protein